MGGADQSRGNVIMDVRMLEADPAWDDSTLDPREIHECLCALARDDAARDVIRGEWLLKGFVARVWEPLGYGSFNEYTERTFGWGPRTTEARAPRITHYAAMHGPRRRWLRCETLQYARYSGGSAPCPRRRDPHLAFRKGLCDVL